MRSMHCYCGGSCNCYFRRENQVAPEGVIVTLGWALALLWALHPS